MTYTEAKEAILNCTGGYEPVRVSIKALNTIVKIQDILASSRIDKLEAIKEAVNE